MKSPRRGMVFARLEKHMPVLACLAVDDAVE
jgi:hypothetical protein